MSDLREHVLRRRKRSRIAATFRALVRTRITTGLLVVLPIFITWFLVKFVFELMRDSSQGFVVWALSMPFGQSLLTRWNIDVAQIRSQLGHAPTAAEFVALLPTNVRWGIGLFSAFLTVFLLYAIGLFTANVFGKRILEAFELLLDRVPLVKTVYRATKQILGTFSGEQTQNLQRVALVPFLSPDVKTIGFITNVARDPRTGEELCTVFHFTTPNPTTGYLLICKRKDVIELDWTVEDAVRAIMSGGLLLPDRKITARVIDMTGGAVPQQPEPQPPRSPDS